MLVLALLTASTAVLAQGNRRDGTILPQGSPGVTVTPIDEPISLHDLVSKAELIIDGTVLSVLPSFNLSPNDPYSIETDSLIGVTKVIGGSLPATLRTISVAQLGGKVGGAEAVVADDPLLKPRETYIFFLVRDDQRKVANSTGFPRYAVVGIWSGKAKVEGGKVRFSANASTDLRGHNDQGVATFIAEVQRYLPVRKGSEGQSK